MYKKVGQLWTVEIFCANCLSMERLAQPVDQFCNKRKMDQGCYILTQYEETRKKILGKIHSCF